MKANVFLCFFLVVFSCSKNQADKMSTNEYYERAWKYWDSKVDDSAFVNFDKAKVVFINRNDKEQAAKCLISMAIIMIDHSDYYGSQEASLEALQYLDRSNEEQREILSSNYNNLGNAIKNLGNYDKANFFYKEAIKNTIDSESLVKYKNNLANNYRYQKEYDRARAYYDSLLMNKKLKEDNVTYSRVVDNLAFTKFLENSNYNAEKELVQALAIREKGNDLWGQNASHAHLSDYFSKKDKEKSLFHAHKMLTIATGLNSPDDRLEALQKLVLLETPENSKMFFLQYQKLNDSLQTVRAKAKNQFALIRYETEKEKAENARKQNHILKQNIVIGTLMFGLFGGFFIYKRRKKRLKQENEMKVKNTQIRYSKKVHDVVANGLYHTMMQIQNNPGFSKEQTLNDIERMYEESRDIARDDDDGIDKDFGSRLSEMINSYSSESQKVLIVGNSVEKWKVIPANVKTEIYYVLREMLTNMVKHSQAKITSIKFDSSETQLSVKYIDNGIGFTLLDNTTESGIKNIKNRIAAIGGTIVFENNPNGGLIVHITVPV